MSSVCSGRPGGAGPTQRAASAPPAKDTLRVPPFLLGGRTVSPSRVQFRLHGVRGVLAARDVVYSDCSLSRIMSAVGLGSQRLVAPDQRLAGVARTCRWMREGWSSPAFSVSAGPAVSSACCTARADSSQLRPIRRSARRCWPHRVPCVSVQAPANRGRA